MTKQEIKQWRRQMIYRKVSRFIRMYGYEAGRTLVGGLLFAGFGGGVMILAGVFY